MRLRTLLTLCLLVAAPAAGLAGTIQIRADAQVERRDDVGLVALDVVNGGDETAHHLSADVRWGDQRTDWSSPDPLAPGGRIRDFLPIDLDESAQRAPFVVVTVHYADAAGYPFSTLFVHRLTPEPAGPALVAGRLDPLRLRDQGTLVLHLEALSSLARDVRVRLWLPEELSAAATERNRLVFPGLPRTVRFALRNRSGTEGSTYAAEATLEYDADGGPRTELVQGEIRIGGGPSAHFDISAAWPWVAAVLLALFGVLQFVPKPSRAAALPHPWWVRHGAALFDGAVLLAVWGFLLMFIPPSLVLRNTTLTGGDVPAHLYLASHLKETLFGQGRILSWAGGWWCGFPMFQFYFPLPYLLAAVGSTVLPFNVAFKLVSLLGVFLLPVAGWGMGRALRLPRPVPALLAVAAIPLLFVRSHVMWGVNLHSTLAGMIANSLSFAILLLALASAFRDAEDETIRLRTVALLVALLASHFFTSVMAAVVLALVPLLRGHGHRWRTLRLLAIEGGLAALLMAWWLVPLLAKSDYSVEFGTNWAAGLLRTLPPYAPWLAPFVVAALVLAAVRRHRAVWLFAWMFVAAWALFLWGFRLSPVFVNIRLWPFLFFALVALAAIGLGLLVQGRRAHELVVAAVLVLAAGWTWKQEAVATGYPAPPVRAWVRWNYSGLEAKPYWRVFEQLVLPLRGTPGRLAYDLDPENNALGSTRVFECVPYLTGASGSETRKGEGEEGKRGKPILEGGLVNSAVGSYFAYYVQGEMSQSSAGFPTRLTPATFDITNGTAHLRLFNVSHFLARWPTLQSALRASPDWRFVRGCDGWELFALRGPEEGRTVTVPARRPVVVETSRWLDCALEWLYTSAAVDQPFVLLDPGQASPACLPRLSEAQFRQYLYGLRTVPGAIGEWLHLGPFRPGEQPGNPLREAYVDETRVDPAEGAWESNRRWTLLFMRGPVDLNRVHPGERGVVTYETVNLFAPAAAAARIKVTVGGTARVWLNGEALTQATALKGAGEWPVTLRGGRNRLMLKLYRADGLASFDAQVTAPDGAAIAGLVATAETAAPAAPAPDTFAAANGTNGVLSASVRDDRIRFRTAAVGVPHLVKCSYYPNWKVRGAAAVYRVTPALMLVVPAQPDVELYYGSTWSDRLGHALALAGAGLFLLALSRRPVPRWFLSRLTSRAAWLKFVDGTAGLALCWLLGVMRFALRREEPAAPELDAGPVRRILVVRPGGMGDMVLLTPVLRRLLAAFPEAAVDLVCEKRNREIVALAGLPRVSLRLYDATPLRLLGRLAVRRYDVAVDTEQFHYFSAVLALLSRAPVRVGFKINPGRNLLYTHLVSYDMDGYEGEQFLRLLEPLGVPREEYRLAGTFERPAVRLPPRAAEAVQRLAEERPLAAVYAGSSTPYKQWGRTKFAELVDRLTRERGFAVVLVGGKEDRATAQWIAGQMEADMPRPVALAGELRLAETAATLAQCRLFVGADSGLGHLAVALGVPTVILFGPSDDRKWSRPDARNAVVRQPTACAPCFIFGYHRLCRSVVCMERITVEDVLQACKRVAV